MVKSIGFAEGATGDVRARLRATLEGASALPGLSGSAVVETMPGARNGAALMWRAAFADEAEWRVCVESAGWRERVAPLLDPAAGVEVDGAVYRPVRQGGEGIAETGIWRMLLSACDAGAPSAAIEEMESDHLLMPRYIPEIRRWSLGRVLHSEGRRRWTHVWEQEYDALDGLTAAYMNHPVHWSLVDRWYDPECPERLVDPLMIHSFGAIPASIMAH